MLLENQDLRLRPFEKEDLSFIHQAFQLELLKFYLPGAWRLFSREQLEGLLSDWNDQVSSFVYIMEEKRTKKALGLIHIDSLDYIHRHAELGICIFHSQERGKGYGKQSLSLVIEYLFLQYNFHRCFARVFSHNSPSLALFSSLGFSEEGRLRQHIYREGKYQDMVLFGLLKEEWLAKNPEKKDR